MTAINDKPEGKELVCYNSLNIVKHESKDKYRYAVVICNHSTHTQSWGIVGTDFLCSKSLIKALHCRDIHLVESLLIAAQSIVFIALLFLQIHV